MSLVPAPKEAAEASKDWTSVPAAALAVVSKHATSRTTPGGCRLARVCSIWRSAVRRIGPVVIRRGASIGATAPMCASLSEWLSKNGSGLVCLQLQGLSEMGGGCTTTSIIMAGLYSAANSAAKGGAPLQLQQLCLDGDSLMAAVRLMPLLPNLQQLELTCVNLPAGACGGDITSHRLKRIRAHQGITRLALNFTATPDFMHTQEYGSEVAELLLRSVCPPQLQELALRWKPPARGWAATVECSIHLSQLHALTQLRKVTLDKVGLFSPYAHPEDADVNAEVAGRLQQVELRFQDVEGIHQQLDADGIPALLPKLVELHATTQTFLAVSEACSNLTSIRISAAAYGNLLQPDQLVMRRLLQRLRKLELPPVTVTDPWSLHLFGEVPGLAQLRELSITSEPGLLGLDHLKRSQQLTSLSLTLRGGPPATFTGSEGAAFWDEVGISQLTRLQHLALQAALLAGAPPAALEALTALTALTVSFDGHWQEQATGVAAVLSSSPVLQQQLRVVYGTGVVPSGVRKVYRALRRALPRTRVEVVTGGSVPAWLKEAV